MRSPLSTAGARRRRRAPLTLACAVRRVAGGSPGRSRRRGREPRPPRPFPRQLRNARRLRQPPPGRASCMASLLVARSSAARAHLHPLGARGRAPARQPPRRPPATSACAPRTCTAPTRCPPRAPRRPDDRARRRLQRPGGRSRPAGLRRRIRPARCTAANGCFTQVNQHGESPQPAVPENVA